MQYLIPRLFGMHKPFDKITRTRELDLVSLTKQKSGRRKRERSSALDLHGIEKGSKSKRECARKRERERARTGPSGGTRSSHKCVYTGFTKKNNIHIHTRFLEQIQFKPIPVRHISWDLGHVGVPCPCFGE